MLVGVISDTHGLMRSQALAALRGSHIIIHAGDVGAPNVLEALAAIAPVFAVRGNTDTQPWAERLPATESVQVAAHKCYVLHDVAQLAIDPVRAGFAAVIFGHSHRPLIETRNGILYLNPGSAGPRRFNLPVCLARIVVSDRGLEPNLVQLTVS